MACIGQFKRGKSTVINALVGQSILPTGVVPVTALPTVIRYGDEAAARARLTSGGWRDVPVESVAAYVSEEQNPDNTKGVEAIEVFVPNPLLADGLCLVDTPGLGSVFEWNAAATRAFVPHIDTAIVVLGTDPPLGLEELDLVTDVPRHTAEMIFILNKADRYSEAERRDAATFAERVLSRRLSRRVGPLLNISALQQVEHGDEGHDWAQLAQQLRRLCRESSTTLVEHARTRGTKRLMDQCLGEIREAADSLQRPLAESERRLERLRSTVGDAAHQSLRLGHMLTAEQEQVDRFLEAQRIAFENRARPLAEADLTHRVRRVADAWGPRARRHALDMAQQTAREHIEPWLREQQAITEEKYRELANQFVETANGFLVRLADSGVPGLERLPRTLDPEQCFRTAGEFRFTELLSEAHGVAPLQWLLDVARPRAARHGPLQRAAVAYLRRLFEVNGARVQNDMRLRVFESRRLLETEVRGILQRVYDSADRALARARDLHAAGADAVVAQIHVLEEARSTIEALRPLPIPTR